MRRLYRKNPFVIEAILFDGEESALEIIEWAKEFGIEIKPQAPNSLAIPTLEGVLTASLGDYVINGVKNEFYACKPDIFKMKYSEMAEGN